MFQAIFRSSAVFLLLAISIALPQTTLAQIAPTNSATISGTVSDSAGKPVVGASVALSGAKNASTHTDGQGLFVFVGVPSGTYQISVSSQSLGVIARNFTVEGDVNVAITYEPASGLKTIANVAANANARFNVTPASITQVSPIQAAFDGQTSWRTILEQIPGVAAAGVGNGLSAGAAYPNSPITPVQLSINGALPYETATLLDDMPLIGSLFNGGVITTGTGTSLSLYPLNAFGSADVIRGPGANAPSIVDSIGGSFVLHAPGVVNANHYELSLSTDPYGGIVSNSLVAVRWKKLSAVLTYGVDDSPGPLSSAIVTSNGLSTTGIPATVNGMYFACGGQCASLISAPGFTANEGGFRTGLLTGGINIHSGWVQHSGSLALHYALSPSVSADVLYTGQRQTVAIPDADVLTTFNAPAGYTGPISSGQYPLNFAGTFLNPNNYNLVQVSSLLEEKVTVQFGRGLFRIEALQNRDFQTLSEATPSSLNVQLYGSGLLCPTNGVGVFACGASSNPGTLTIFNGGTYAATYNYVDFNCNEYSNNRDVLLSYTTPIGNLHAGASFVKSYYDSRKGIPFEYASSTPLNFTSPECSTLCGSETTQEMRIFVGGNPSAKTSLDLSMYFASADYHVPANGGAAIENIVLPPPVEIVTFTQPSAYTDSVFSYAAPRLGFVWRPTAAVAIRAAAGGGFAEAPLVDLIGTNGVPSCVSGVCAVTLGNANLQPEKSFAFDLGTDIRLRHNTLFSFDVYRSNLYGQVYQTTGASGTCSSVPSCPGGDGAFPLFITQYGNLGLSRFEGVLLDVRHDVPRGTYWALSGGLTRGYVVSVPAGFYNTKTGTCVPSTGVNCNAPTLTVVPGINFNGTFAASVPYAQALGTLGYRWSPSKYVDLVGTYLGNGNTYFQPAFIEWNGHIGYPLSKNSSLLVTFQNITGVYDGAVQTISPANLAGAPTISGPPAPLYQEQYGPRTVLLTMQMHL